VRWLTSNVFDAGNGNGGEDCKKGKKWRQLDGFWREIILIIIRVKW
jgi:hypothetical protein